MLTVLQVDEMKLPEKLSKLQLFDEQLPFTKTYIKLWLSGEPIEKLRNIWTTHDPHFTPDHMNMFIETVLNYLLPWGTSAFYNILCYKLEKKKTEFPQEIAYLPAYYKCGVTNKYACWARSMGVPTRETAIVMGNYYSDFGLGDELKNFVRWYSNLDYEELLTLGATGGKNEIARIIQSAQKLNTNRFVGTGYSKTYEFYVRGIPYDEERIRSSQKIKVSDTIELKREYNNPYDIYAILIKYNESPLGYVPRELAKEIAVNMDVDNTRYIGTVLSKGGPSKGYRIKVKITDMC
ncbi:MAG: HIRAN domain-containing protein [Negativicutes bacterium]